MESSSSSQTYNGKHLLLFDVILSHRATREVRSTVRPAQSEGLQNRVEHVESVREVVSD
jgi:hypothetical protein